ncbi:MAG: zinc metalloprotease, partial [Amphiamblys sp. WSBS2006]
MERGLLAVCVFVVSSVLCAQEDSAGEETNIVFSSEGFLYVLEVSRNRFISPENKPIKIYLDGEEAKESPSFQTFDVRSIGKSECDSGSVFEASCRAARYGPVFMKKIAKKGFQWEPCSGQASTSTRGGILYVAADIKKEDGKSYKINKERGKHIIKEDILAGGDHRSDAIGSPLSKKRRKIEMHRRSERRFDENNTLYIGVAADCSFCMKFESTSEAQTAIVNVFSRVHRAFKDGFGLNVYVSKIYLREECAPEKTDINGPMGWNVSCDGGATMRSRLSSFAQWRGEQKDDLGLYHLMTGCVDGTVLGMAYQGKVCRTESWSSFPTDVFGPAGGRYSISGVSLTRYHDGQVFSIIHEIGHNLGAAHDCTAEECSIRKDTSECRECDGCDCKGKYIMNPLEIKTAEFSKQSKDDIFCLLLEGSGAACLKPEGERERVQAAVCGNGIKEEGEECDCGDEESC